MKLLIATIAVLWMVDTAFAQDVTPATPPANLKAPVGVKYIPEPLSPDALANRIPWEPLEPQTLIAEALTVYKATKRPLKKLPMKVPKQ